MEAIPFHLHALTEMFWDYEAKIYPLLEFSASSKAPKPTSSLKVLAGKCYREASHIIIVGQTYATSYCNL